MNIVTRSSTKIAIVVVGISLFACQHSAMAAPPAPIIFADGISVFTDRAGFNLAAGKVCQDIDKIWFDSSEGNIGPSNTIFGETHEGLGVTFTSTSLFTGTDGHSDAQGPFSDVTLTPTQSKCEFDTLGFDITRGDGSIGKDITLTLSSGDTITETIGPSSNLFFGIVAPDGFTGASVTTDAILKSIQQVRVCGDTCTDDPSSSTPEPGAMSTLTLGGLALLGALVAGRKRTSGRLS